MSLSCQDESPLERSLRVQVRARAMSFFRQKENATFFFALFCALMDQVIASENASAPFCVPFPDLVNLEVVFILFKIEGTASIDPETCLRKEKKSRKLFVCKKKNRGRTSWSENDESRRKKGRKRKPQHSFQPFFFSLPRSLSKKKTQLQKTSTGRL